MNFSYEPSSFLQKIDHGESDVLNGAKILPREVGDVGVRPLSYLVQ